jgi:hypothetical protein
VFTVTFIEMERGVMRQETRPSVNIEVEDRLRVLLGLGLARFVGLCRILREHRLCFWLHTWVWN